MEVEYYLITITGTTSIYSCMECGAAIVEYRGDETNRNLHQVFHDQNVITNEN